MKHLSMEEWDRHVAPILGAMEIRCGWVKRDVAQLSEWMQALPYAPGFEAEAEAKLREIQADLLALTASLEQIIIAYDKKEKVT